MRSASELNNCLRGIVSNQWPNFKGSVEFSPLIDRILGDVGTSVAVLIARAFQISPQVVLQKLLADWPSQFCEVATIDRDYFNIRLPICAVDVSAEIFWPEINKSQPFIIFLPCYYQGQSVGGYLRLGARALLQHELLLSMGYSSAVVRLEDGVRLEGASHADRFRNFIDRWFERTHVDIDLLIFKIRAELSKEGAKRFLWLLPATIPARDFQLLFPVRERNRNLELKYSDAKWANLLCDLSTIHALSRKSDRDLAGIQVLLAEESPGSDVDFYVGGSSENANLLWFIDNIINRSRSLGQFEISEQMVSENEELRALIRFQVLLPWFVSRAAECGEVAELTCVLREFATIFTLLFNNPKFRITQMTIGKNQGGVNILAGVCGAVSAMLRNCPVFSLSD